MGGLEVGVRERSVEGRLWGTAGGGCRLEGGLCGLLISWGQLNLKS